MTDFLSRLKQRKLVQWALAYVAFAFALIQVLDVVAQRFAWPDQLERVLILALAVGFFAVIVLAWYHGERGAQRVSSTEIVILALLLAIGGGLLWRFERAPNALAVAAQTRSPDAAQRNPGITTRDASAHAIEIPAKSVAVLPLNNESGEKDQQYFSDGLSEDLINALSQFAGLKVISRNSSFQFRDSKQPSAAIGRALGVAHLLEGSVQKLGNEVRISAELVNAADGSTLWSQHYDRPYKDLFALQDDITSAVADALKAKLLEGGGAVAQSDRPPSGNQDAWNAYSRGRFYGLLIDPEDARKAIGFYEQAIALDPRYARAYASLSYAQTTLAATFLAGEAQRQAYAKGRAAANRALQLDPEMARAHVARGLLLASADFDWSGAEAEYGRAVMLSPNDGQAKFELGNLLSTLGHPNQAIPLIRQSIAIDPRNSSNRYWLAWDLAAVGQPEAAEQSARKAIELTPGKSFLPTGLAIIQIQRGQIKAALAAAQQEPPGPWHEFALTLTLQVGGDRGAADAALKTLIAGNAEGMAYQIAEVYGLRKQPDDVFAWLDRAWANRDPGIDRLLTDPFILRYKDDPRFAAFCRKVGLPTTTDARAMP
jgi:TolB-like protein/Tfp pilus assembly protein PilF